MTDIITLKCPHCNDVTHRVGIPKSKPSFDGINPQCQCWYCHKDYEYCLVRIQLTNELVQAPFCHNCKKPMTIVKSEHTERTDDYMITYIIHEWECSQKSHLFHKNKIFIGLQTTGLILTNMETLNVRTA